MAFLLSGFRRRRDAVIAILTVVTLILVMMGYAQNQRVQALTLQVSATYQKALYETVELMRGVQLGFEKLLVSGSSAHEQMLLTDISRQADGAQDNLSIMPPGEAALEGAVKFTNQAGDYARVLAEKLSNGGSLTADDRTQITTLHKSAVELNIQLLDMEDRLDRGEFAFDVNTAVMENLSQENTDQSKALVEYPALLYDGPFSDARDTGTIKVAGAAITADEASEKLRTFIGNDRVQKIDQTGESSILSECYEFDVLTESGTLSASVTKAGGHVLYMLPNSAIESPKLTVGECVDAGMQFLSSRGFGEMAFSYWQQQDAILTVNYAAKQGGVILYPDLIKLQINMQNGLVVGVESVNYLRNHTFRALPTPVITEEMAMADLNEALNIQQIRRCIIPTDAGEAQCWEITARFEGGNLYLIYIDILSGREQSILQLIDDGDGMAAR